MAIQLLAALPAVLGAVARTAPAVAGAVGRGAASGAARMGASQGTAGMVGKAAESGTKYGMTRAAVSAVSGPPKESRNQSFLSGVTTSMGSGSGYSPMQFMPDNNPPW